MHKESIPRNLEDSLSKSFVISLKQKKRLDSSLEAFIYENFYKVIDESDYAVLYDNKARYSKNNFLSQRRGPVGRPNTPVRDLITALIMLDLYGWSHKMLFDNLEYNILTRRAFGFYGLGDSIFSEATFYNFQNKLLEHWVDTGVNLLELSFKKFSSDIIKKLQIKTGILRIDSFQAMSNIANYTKLRLLIELVRRLFRVLNKEEQESNIDLFSKYLKVSSGKFVYRLVKDEYLSKLEKLGFIYYKLLKTFEAKYRDNIIFKRFSRAFNEHFEIDANENITPKIKGDFKSNMLQSPDDDDATYRYKNTKGYKGQVVTVTETASPENKVNLIVDISIDANNVHDSEILASRIDDIKSRFTDISEVHADASYGSEETDEKLGDALIVTSIRGRTAKVKILIEKTQNDDFVVKCPFQKQIANKGKKRYKAVFDKVVCETCPLKDICNLNNTKKGKVYSFTKKQATINMRNNRLYKIPEERRKIRANVEATVKEFTKILNHKGKFKVRGHFKTAIHTIATSIGINLARIFRFLRERGLKNTVFYYIMLFLTQIKLKTKLKAYKLNKNTIEDINLDYRNFYLARGF